MRFLHTADWHIGKKLHGYDLLKNQEAALKEILALAQKEAVDAIVVAGDLYDRSVPAVEAVELLNRSLYEMNLQAKIPILAISGNHDSGPRLGTGSPWFSQNQFHLHTRMAQALVPVEFETVQFFLLPYFEPIEARLYFDEELTTIGAAVARVLEEMQKAFHPEKKQVLVTHFFVAGSSRTDSETSIAVGGLDSVPKDLFAPFDYVALGHLHSKNALKEEKVRYSGSLLKYSLSEINDEKGLLLVDMDQATVTFHSFPVVQEIQTLTASFAELTDPKFYQALKREDFWHFTLTDRAVIPNMMNQLRQIYPFILSVDRLGGQTSLPMAPLKKIKQKSPEKLAQTFFTEMTGDALTPQQSNWLKAGLVAASETEKRGILCNQEN